LKNVAITAMTGKGAESSKEKLSDLAVRALKQIMDKEDGKITIDSEDIKIEKKVGGSVEDSELIEGVVFDKERVHSGMPRVIESAKIALIDSALEIKGTEIDAKIQITDPAKMQEFIDMEENMLRKMVEKLLASGANVVFCQKRNKGAKKCFFVNNEGGFYQ